MKKASKNYLQLQIDALQAGYDELYDACESMLICIDILNKEGFENRDHFQDLENHIKLIEKVLLEDGKSKEFSL